MWDEARPRGSTLVLKSTELNTKFNQGISATRVTVSGAVQDSAGVGFWGYFRTLPQFIKKTQKPQKAGIKILVIKEEFYGTNEK